MKIQVHDGEFMIEVDWSKLNTIDGGRVEEFFPDPEEVAGAVLMLLEWHYPIDKLKEAFLEECS